MASPSFEGDYLRFYFPEEFGGRHELLEISKKVCSSSVAETLGIPHGEAVTELYRLRYFDDETEPSVLEKSYLNKELYEKLKEQDLNQKLYDVLENELGIELVKSRNVIEPVLPSKLEANYLKINTDMPVMLLSRVCYTYNDSPVILTKSLVRADKCKLLIIN